VAASAGSNNGKRCGAAPLELGLAGHGQWRSDLAACWHEVILPFIFDFAPFAQRNWDTAALKTMMPSPFYTDDRFELFERVLVYYNQGPRRWQYSQLHLCQTDNVRKADATSSTPTAPDSTHG